MAHKVARVFVRYQGDDVIIILQGKNGRGAYFSWDHLTLKRADVGTAKYQQEVSAYLASHWPPRIDAG